LAFSCARGTEPYVALIDAILDVLLPRIASNISVLPNTGASALCLEPPKLGILGRLP
jgi:hypothetical protein